MKKLLIVSLIVLLLCCSGVTMAATKDSEEIPSKVKVISQSCNQSSLYLTVIDLSNNEVVIIVYHTPKFYEVIRTGMFVDPNTQNPVSGQSAPFQK